MKELLNKIFFDVLSIHFDFELPQDEREKVKELIKQYALEMVGEDRKKDCSCGHTWGCGCENWAENKTKQTIRDRIQKGTEL